MLHALDTYKQKAEEEHQRQVNQAVEMAKARHQEKLFNDFVMPMIKQHNAVYGGGGGGPTAGNTKAVGNPYLDYSDLKKTLQQGHVEIKVPKQEESSQKESDKHPNTKKEKSSSQNKREKAIKKYLQDNTAVFNSNLSTLLSPATVNASRNTLQKLSNPSGYSLYADKIIPNKLYPYIANGFTMAIKGYPIEATISGSLSKEQVEAIKAGYNIADGKYPWDDEFKEIDKYQKAPLRLNNGDVVISTGTVVPKVIIDLTYWWEAYNLKDIKDNIATFVNKILPTDFSMTPPGIKPSRVKEVIQNGHFQNLKEATKAEIIDYVSRHPYESTGEIIGSSMDRWMNTMYPEGYSFKDLEQNIALILQLYHFGDKKPPHNKPLVEADGYGVLAHNHYWYDIKNKPPQYSDKLSFFKDIKGERTITSEDEVRLIIPSFQKKNDYTKKVKKK
jgi:hypothetical protein